MFDWAEGAGARLRCDRRRPLALAAVAALVASLSSSLAFADERGQEGSPPLAATVRQTREALESSEGLRLDGPATDPQAAAQSSHRDLGRSEALQLAEAVFGSQLGGPPSLYLDLEPTRFLSDYAAVVPSDSLHLGPERDQASGDVAAESAPVVVESSLPLRTEGSGGAKETVDLSLERADDQLQPANPLTEVGLPEELGEGIALPDVGVTVQLVDAPEGRAPSNVEGKFGFYPNVAQDTDLIVSPVPTGFETLADIRSAEAPMTQAFNVSVPPGAELKASSDGGAEVLQGGRALVTVPPPSAIDAAGAEVPVTLDVAGSQIELTVALREATQYPVLLDPVFLDEAWNWAFSHDGTAGWSTWSTTTAYRPLPYMRWNPGYPGLDVTSGFAGSAPYGSNAAWLHYVPRYAQDISEFGVPPTSWIHELYAEGVMFLTNGNWSAYPVLMLGLVDPNNGWATFGTHYGSQGDMTSFSNHFMFFNEHEMTGVKLAEMNLATFEAEAGAKLRDAYLASAVTVIADDDPPKIKKLTAPDEWMNTTPVPVDYEFEDTGLGVRAAMVTVPGASSAHPGWGVELACAGTSTDPCPRYVKSGEAGRPAFAYDPTELPAGNDVLEVTLGDATWSPNGHEVAGSVVVKVDHAAPTLALSGSLTEQGTLGTELPQYTLKYAAADGGEDAPSLISAVGSEGSAAGQFKHPGDVAVDDNRNIWIADQNNNRIEKETEQGQFTAYGSLGSGNGQLSHPGGVAVDAANNVWVADTGNNRVEEFNGKGEFVRVFGSLGSGNGKLSSPQGIAVDSQGNVWVADTGNNRVEEFSAEGEFKGAFGGAGSAPGQLSEPSALAIGPDGNVWVADTANNRVEEFSAAGEFLAAYGSLGSGNGQFDHPAAIEVDTWGNVWVGDRGNGRVVQLSERGEFLGKFGSPGSGPGQFSFSTPIGITAARDGELWVTDSTNNRIESWSRPRGTQSGVRSVVIKVDGKVVAQPKLTCETGGCPLVDEWKLQAGEYAAGSHTVEVTATDGVGLAKTEKRTITLNPPMPSLTLSGTMTEQASLGTTRPRYTLALNAGTELGNGTPPSTPPTYTRSIGTAGSGNGQLSHPGDVAIDASDNLWVVDENHDRLQKFDTKGNYLAQLGSSGSGNGQLSRPTAVAIDSAGSIWVADAGNRRVEKFSSSGAYVTRFGSAGSGNGQFGAAGPEGIAIDASGHLWVSDTSGSRLEEFTKGGVFMKAVGSVGGKAGQLSEPTALDIAANGNVWVADWANQRVEVYNQAGEWVRQFGSEGTGQGKFRHPDGLAIDAGGNVLVGDENNERVQVFNQSGRYLTQFGSAGSGPGQLSFGYPIGIAVDTHGIAWVTDSGDNRVERWREPSRSSIRTEILLDGSPVETGEVSCATESCPGALEWTLESPARQGKHTILAKVTDGFGHTTSKLLLIEVQPDTVKPSLEVAGELANAPEGWVQQGEYGLHASATDVAGYGVTSLAFKIDGATVASESQPCDLGSCEASLSETVDMASYSGGAHPAEVIATDGAGNTATHRWTINVDPEGHISTAEATDTLEALEATSEANVVGNSEAEAGVEGSAAGLGIEATEGHLQATGTDVPLTIELEASGGFSAEVPEASAYGFCGVSGEPEGEAAEEEFGPAEEQEVEAEVEEEEVCEKEPEEEPESEGNAEGLISFEVTPVDAKEGASLGKLVDENAVVSSNTSEASDTVTRPLSDGAMVFSAIRDSSAPEEHSWRINLSHNQTLRLIDDQHAEVYFDNTRPAFSIGAQPAHDAVGTNVPTTLSIEHGDIVTLTVHYKAGHDGQPFVYPIVGGIGWEGGFLTTEVELAEAQPEDTEEESTVENTPYRVTLRLAAISAADRPAGGGGEPYPARAYRATQCEFEPWFPAEAPDVTPYPVKREALLAVLGGCLDPGESTENLVAAIGVKGRFHYQSGEGVWVKPDEHAFCYKWKYGHHQPSVVHCGVRPKSSKTGITARGDFRWPKSVLYPAGPECETLYLHLNASAPHRTLPDPIYHQVWGDEPCPWPSWPNSG